LNLDDCEKVFEQALSSASGEAFCRAVEPLFSEYEILSLVLGRGDVFWRARAIGKEIYPNVSDLDYPPERCARLGRLNDAGVPCFYIATRRETALAEIGAEAGQLVQLAGFKVLVESPIRLAVIGEYANVQKNGYMHFAGRDPDRVISKGLNSLPREQGLKILYIDRFFAHVLADPSASSNGYMFSRALSKAIYARNGADGIVFPSVKDRGGFNIAVQAGPSDRCLHNGCCLVAQVRKTRMYGLIDYQIIKTARELDANGNFVWGSGDPEMITMYNMTKDEYAAHLRNPGEKHYI